jgi:hypothetical protein
VIQFLRVVAAIAYLLMIGTVMASIDGGTIYFTLWPIFGIWGTVAIAAAAILKEVKR